MGYNFGLVVTAAYKMYCKDGVDSGYIIATDFINLKSFFQTRMPVSYEQMSCHGF